MNREAAASQNGNAENEKGKCQLHATFVGDGFLLNSNCSFCMILSNSLFPNNTYVLLLSNIMSPPNTIAGTRNTLYIQSKNLETIIMEPSKKQLAMEAKRNRRTVTVETGRPWLGGGWLQRKETRSLGSGPHVQTRPVLGLSSLGPASSQLSVCRVSSPACGGVGSGPRFFYPFSHRPHLQGQRQPSRCHATACVGPTLCGPTCHRSALRLTSLFTLVVGFVVAEAIEGPGHEFLLFSEFSLLHGVAVRSCI